MGATGVKAVHKYVGEISVRIQLKLARPILFEWPS